MGFQNTHAGHAGGKGDDDALRDGTVRHIREDTDLSSIQGQSTSRGELTPALERRLVAKIDLAIAPMVCVMYLFCFIDRSNIGNARIAGLERDLGLHGYDFNIALTCFAVSYAAFQVPASLCCKWMGPGWFLPLCTVGFGLAAVGTGLVRTRAQLFAVRVVLGAFESAMFPGIAYYMSRWYRRAELGFRLSLYIATAPLAGAFGGLLASAVLGIHGGVGALRGWRVIFAVEGVATVGAGVLGLLLLTDGPATARWLTPRERELVAGRLLAERVAAEEVLDSISRAKVRRGLTNPVALATGVLFFMNSLTVQGLSIFLPTIVSTIYPDASVVRQQLYTVPPYAVGVVMTLGLSGVSWWLDRRNVILVLSALPVLVAYALFISTLDASVRYASAFLVASTCFVPGSMTSAQVSANVVSDTTRSVAMAVNVMLGGFGGILATWAFLPFDAPYYRIGNGINLASTSIWLSIGIGLRVWMHLDNRRRGSMKAQEVLVGLDAREIQNLDWKNPKFRWRP